MLTRDDERSKQPAAPAALDSTTTRPPSPTDLRELAPLIGNRAVGRVLARRGGRRPPPPPPALPGTLIGALPEAQRLALREVTDQVASIPLASLAPPPPPPGTRPAPGGATVSVSPAPELGFTPQTPDVRRALNAVVSHLVRSTLTDNTTGGVFLDLRPYGGEHGVYRFTKVAGGGATRYLVDFIQATTPTPAPSTGIGTTHPFFIHRFEYLDPRGATTTTNATLQQDELRFRGAAARAATIVPDAFLGLVEGLKFRRQATHPTDPRAGGDYNHQTHTITIYDRMMAPTLARFDDPGGGEAVDNLVRAIIHEIGHAVDQVRIRAAFTRLAGARRDLDSAFGQFATAPAADGSVSYENIPGQRMRDFNRLQGAAQTADTAYTRARGETGSGYQATDVAGASTRFTRALGTSAALTAYAEESRAHSSYAVESFAEGFSLFVTEPETLRALRPAQHTYFTELQANPARAR